MLQPILIVDSGWGGLWITKDLIAQLQKFQKGATIQYVNLAPSHEQGYNQISSRHAKIQTFENAFNAVIASDQPTIILLACNSLAALLPHVNLQFDKRKIWSVIEEGVNLIVPKLQKNPDSLALIFSTETTANEGIYPDILQQSGIEKERVVSIPCQGLASLISSGHLTKMKEKIDDVMRLAYQKIADLNLFPNCQTVYGILACTHYASVQTLFEEMGHHYFNEKMEVLEIQYKLNQDLEYRHNQVSVNISGKYQINDTEKKTWKGLLANSIELQYALDQMQVIEDLFGSRMIF